MMEDILSVKHLNAYYKKKQALFDINFSIKKGEIVGLVGESGSGKTTLAKAVLGTIDHVEGEVIHSTKDPQMIFQDPFHSLNPAMKVGRFMEEGLRIRRIGDSQTRRQTVMEMMERVGLEPELMERYPDELSGGQRQRICIGTALMQNPQLILADEPVSALDVTVQAKVLKLLCELNRTYQIAFLFISHDLRVVYELCERILIMQEGRIIEQGTDEEVFFHPKEEYTQKLLSAIM